MQEPQNSLGERARWFRVGIVSATVLTPLVSRWQTLRAAERARALWQASRSGAQRPWVKHEATPDLPPLARKSNLSTGLWLAGVGVGLVAAGTAAYFVARRRMAARDEEPLELSLSGPNGADGNQDMAEAELIVSAVFAGSAAGPSARRDYDETLRQSGTDDEGNDGDIPAARMPTSEEPETTGASTTLRDGTPAGATEPEQAPFIGDVRTLVYHEAGDENLPAEGDQVYFASREDAEGAGYHPHPQRG